ncbi:MAG: hypothetical protein Q9219_003225 [cf. Caloplaca sp. 3 TL-2023]
MTSNPELPSLPDILFNAWQFGENDISEAKARGELQGWNVSSLCSAYLKYQLTRHEHELQAGAQSSIPSLMYLSIGHILKTLKSSIDLRSDLQALADNTDPATLQHLFQDPRTPYSILHVFCSLRSTFVEGSTGHRGILDIDESVLANEKHVRSRKLASYSDYLVNLDHLSTILGRPEADGLISFKRKLPPKGGFEFLDQKKKQLVRLHGTDTSFIKTFDRVTNGILKGLDWANVFIIGGMVINTLLHTDPSENSTGDIFECDIDMYLYGLSPEEANQKVEDIYKVWSTNLGTGSEHVVVKSPQTIAFLPEYPHRRVQIILKLLSSPLEGLLRVDLDPCAIGFDGSHVIMLPRCARAIETGYSVFTMDLIWGHRLGNRRETQEVRIFKYADRGFGLRILPSYVQSLGRHAPRDSGSDGNNSTAGEPGLKILRRIAHRAQHFVHGCFFGKSKEFYSVYIAQEYPNPDTYSEEDLQRNSELPNSNVDDQPSIVLPVMDTQRQSPNGPLSLGVFELLMRHCEAWRLDAVGLACLNRHLSVAFSYDNLSFYDTQFTYKWNSSFIRPLEDLENRVRCYNGSLYIRLRWAIEQKLGVIPHPSAYIKYLTRRIRRHIAGPDLKFICAKQITIPVIIPSDLESYITTELAFREDEILNQASSELLIPAHDRLKYDPNTALMPSLHDTTNESGNVRYWLVTNKSMWANQRRVLDEVSELLRALFVWFYRREADETLTGLQKKYGTDNPECIWQLASIFRQRLVLPEMSDIRQRGEVLSERESCLFQAWALAGPPRLTLPPERLPREEDKEKFRKFRDEVENEPNVPDEVFWKDGDEGTWNVEEGVPMWQPWDD